MTIAEVSRQYDISADTLRYYERVGLIPSVTRNKSGFRDYSEEDCNWVSFIKCMRRAGVQVEALIEYVSPIPTGNGTQEARKQLLIEQRDLLKAKTEGDACHLAAFGKQDRGATISGTPTGRTPWPSLKGKTHRNKTAEGIPSAVLFR